MSAGRYQIAGSACPFSQLQMVVVSTPIRPAMSFWNSPHSILRALT